MWRCHQFLYGFLANGHLSRVLDQSRLTANKGDNEMIHGAVHRSPSIYLTTEENPGNPQLGDSLMKVVRLVIASVWVPYLEMISVGSHSMLGRYKERIEEAVRGVLTKHSA